GKSDAPLRRRSRQKRPSGDQEQLESRCLPSQSSLHLRRTHRLSKRLEVEDTGACALDPDVTPSGDSFASDAPLPNLAQPEQRPPARPNGPSIPAPSLSV